MPSPAAAAMMMPRSANAANGMTISVMPMSLRITMKLCSLPRLRVLRGGFRLRCRVPLGLF